MMYFLAIQNNYDEVQCALMKEATQIAYTSISKIKASAELVSHLNDMLITHGVSLTDLSFIAVNCGPGPFTTLRVVIATVNGIAYASGIPLLAINGLKAAASEWHNDSYGVTAIFFNAFGNDVYTLIIKNNEELMYGVYGIETILDQLRIEPGSIRFLGNGTTLHKKLIESRLGAQAYIPETVPPYCSLKTIAHIGYKQWKSKKTGESAVMPVYLKQHPAMP